MTKKLIIRIKSFDEALEDFRRTFKNLQAGKKRARQEGIYFTSIEAAQNLLTKTRLELLHTIRYQKPRSIYQLAKLVGRNLKNVQADLQLLEAYGLVKLIETKSGDNRHVKVPKVPYEEIDLKIPL